MVMRAWVGGALLASLGKHRPQEEVAALAKEYFQRVEEAVAAEPEKYGVGTTILYSLFRKN